MQNAPTMLNQKMMNRQAPYGPIGMVAQNMSGNKKGGAVPSGPVIGLAFDTTTATAGVTFSNSNTTATNATGGAIASAKGNATTTTGGTSTWYWEFVIGSTDQMYVGVGLSTFTCNAANQVGRVLSSVGYYSTTGAIYGNGPLLISVASASTGDVISFQLSLTAASSSLRIRKNGTQLANINTTAYLPNSSNAWVPIWSADQTNAIATISNNIYEYAGFTPIGTVATRIAASASVPAVVDGAYDVYTFNSTGTFTAASTGAVRALVIAGGGGGGGYASGNGASGGGAGGYLENGATVTPQTYTVTVGGGGVFFTSAGNNSSLGSLISTTGGGSSGGGFAGAAGGSGSGGSQNIPGPNTRAGGAGVSGQGFAGGQGNSVSAVLYGAGGGGGANSVGGAGNIGSNGIGGNGGTGKTSDITGIGVGRGGGGSGNGYLGSGTFSDGGKDVSGTSNTGGGGGWNLGNGGSGVVIIRVRARA